MKKSSIIFADVLVLLSLISVVALGIFAMPLAEWYVEWRNIDPILKTVIPTAFWICAVPTIIALLGLMALLRNLFRGKIFEAEKYYIKEDSQTATQCTVSTAHLVRTHIRCIFYK